MRNVDIWEDAHVYPMAEFLREKRLRWVGHVQRRDKEEATRKILQMTVDGKRGRPKLRWRALVKQDMARNQLRWQKTEHIGMSRAIFASYATETEETYLIRQTIKCRGGKVRR